MKQIELWRFGYFDVARKRYSTTNYLLTEQDARIHFPDEAQKGARLAGSSARARNSRRVPGDVYKRMAGLKAMKRQSFNAGRVESVSTEVGPTDAMAAISLRPLCRMTLDASCVSTPTPKRVRRPTHSESCPRNLRSRKGRV